MMKNKNLIIAALLFGATLLGYLTFKSILQNNHTQPITYELLAALIGVIITAILTSLLLNKQTEAELKKEENIKFLDLKTKIYTELLEQLNDIVMKKKIQREDLMELRLLNQKLTFVASSHVLISFSNFTEKFAKMAQKESITEDDIDNLFLDLSLISVNIREDLLSNERIVEETNKIKTLVLKSNKNLDID